MKLKYCSLTGADDDVNPEDLRQISREYPFAEWAILLMRTHAGQPRFPTADWIQRFAASMRDSHTAMHLCGEAFLAFMDQDPDVRQLMSGFQRIQLNLKFGDMAGKYDPATLVARVRENPSWQFIIQYTPDNRHLLPLFQDIPNHAILFDASAGRGVAPDSWDSPIPGHFCGYAGGLNPDNIEKHLESISKAASGQIIWVDMESGVRTNDKFDLGKVRSVLASAAPYTTGTKTE